jgi:hypothetical protein
MSALFIFWPDPTGASLATGSFDKASQNGSPEFFGKSLSKVT